MYLEINIPLDQVTIKLLKPCNVKHDVMQLIERAKLIFAGAFCVKL